MVEFFLRMRLAGCLLNAMKNNIIRKFVPVSALSLFAFFTMNPNCQAAEEGDVRAIAIPAQEHGYSNFETMVIASQADLDEFMKTVGDQSGWNEQEKFTKAIAEANLDFEKEQLVLIRHDEGSGSVQLTFHKPTVDGMKVVCKIDRKAPEIGTADMAFYCYALAVAKRGPTHVELQVEGRQSVDIPLQKE